jgi:hypothetical protein
LSYFYFCIKIRIMILSEKKIRELNEKLVSKNTILISETILSLRNEPPFRGAIGILAGFYNNSEDKEIKDHIRNFLNDIKEPDARIEILSELKNKYTNDTIAMLVCSCWQSGLDYADYAINFAEVLIKGDFLTALECFTVIEESAMNISTPVKRQIIDLLEMNIEGFNTEKAKLSMALISALK